MWIKVQRCPSYERLLSDSSSLTGTRPETETPNLDFTLAIPNLPLRKTKEKLLITGWVLFVEAWPKTNKT